MILNIHILVKYSNYLDYIINSFSKENYNLFYFCSRLWNWRLSTTMNI